MKLNVYSAKGIRKGSTNLPNNFVQKINLSLLAQAVRVYEDRQHPGLAKTKTRGEVTASTRKIYRQKGTGGARHGAISAPIFVGGGVAHGPKGVKRVLSLPKKIKDKALGVALSLKASEGQLLVVDGFSTLKKTKEAANLINEISKKEGFVKNPKMTFALSEKNKYISQVIDNISGVRVLLFGSLNAYRVYQSRVLIIDKEALEGKSTSEKSKKGIKGTTGRVSRKVLKSTESKNIMPEKSAKSVKNPRIALNSSRGLQPRAGGASKRGKSA